MILVVEDEAISRYAFAQTLGQNGHKVIEAKEGFETLTLLEKYPIKLVITDLVMPRMDGAALVAQIREEWPDMPIVIMSGYAIRYAELALDELTEFLPKPIEPAVLVATVQRLLVVNYDCTSKQYH